MRIFAEFGEPMKYSRIISPVTHCPTAPRAQTTNSGIGLLFRRWLSEEETMPVPVVRHQSICFEFGGAARDTFLVHDVERSRGVEGMAIECPYHCAYVIAGNEDSNRPAVGQLLSTKLPLRRWAAIIYAESALNG